MSAQSPDAVEGLLEAFSTTLEAIPGGVRISMPRTQVTVGGVRDSMNGGVLAALIEVAAHLALRPLLAAGEQIEGTVDLGVSYLRSARGNPTLAEARVLRKGRQLCVCAIEVLDGETRELNAVGRVTLAITRGA